MFGPTALSSPNLSRSFARSKYLSMESTKRYPCDQCNRRKVRCDYNIPCSKCRDASTPCTHILVRKKV